LIADSLRFLCGLEDLLCKQPVGLETPDLLAANDSPKHRLVHHSVALIPSDLLVNSIEADTNRSVVVELIGKPQCAPEIFNLINC
jgi:hypothetical protein